MGAVSFSIISACCSINVSASEVLVTQSCPTLGSPVDCRPPGSCPCSSPGESTGVGCHALLQGSFLTQGSNPGLPYCRWILYRLSHKGSPTLLTVACQLINEGGLIGNHYFATPVITTEGITQNIGFAFLLIMSVS